MRRHQPDRRDLKAFYQAMHDATEGPNFTPEYLAFLARRRDQYMANLASR